MSPHELQSAIVTFVNQPDYQPVKPRVIARRLGLPKEESADVRRAVKLLVRQGKLSYASNHLVRPAETKTTLSAPIPQRDEESLATPGLPLPVDEVTFELPPPRNASGQSTPGPG